MKPIATIVVVFALCHAARAEVQPNVLIADHMVIQQGMPANIWGTADPSEEVTVRFAGQEKTATADGKGAWRVALEPMKAADHPKPMAMTIVGKDEPITINDVAVGEVWLCSGQSNMVWMVAVSANASAEILASSFPGVRMTTVLRTAGGDKWENAKLQFSWRAADPKTTGRFSAVAYYFGRELHQRLNVPIGLINSSVGGTPIEAWTSREGLKQVEAAKPILDRFAQALVEFPEKQAAYEKKYAVYKEKVQAARAAGENVRKIRPPNRPMSETHTHSPGGLFNHMIYPLRRYTIRGAIWYQGETNRSRGYQYRDLLPGMITDWRELWGQGDFPFGVVQLANYRARKDAPSQSGWAEVREAQLLAAQNVANTGLAVIIDIGDAKDIHPKNKQDVGKRLSLWALANAYGQQLVYSGPIYRDMKVDGDAIRLTFDHAGGGLVAKNGDELVGFAIAGEDKQFVWATATIDGDTVVVHSETVKNPVAVRYAWADNPACNLYNKEGLPAAPFRTDDWPGVSVNNR